MSRRTSQIALGLGLMAISTSLTLALSELALRVFSPQSPSWLAIYRRHPELPFHALMPDENVLVDTGETRWTVMTDADGFRIGSHQPANARCRALWLGDSFAFGHGVGYDDSIVGVVQERTPAVLQLNTAAPGYGPVQYRELLEYEYRRGRNPEIIYVVTYVGNDFHDSIWDKDVPVHEGILGHGGDLKSWLKTHVHLYRLVAAALHRIAPAAGSPFDKIFEQLADPDVWTQEPLAGARTKYAAEMARILELGRAHGAEVHFLVLPTQPAVEASRAGRAPDPAADPMLPVREAMSVLQAIGAQGLDVTPVLAARPTDEIFLAFDGHLTAEGNHVVADALLEAWPSTCRDGEPKS